MAQNPFYVYALKDPRDKPAKPFYVGKGTGNRAWDHQKNIDDSISFSTGGDTNHFVCTKQYPKHPRKHC